MNTLMLILLQLSVIAINKVALPTNKVLQQHMKDYYCFLVPYEIRQDKTRVSIEPIVGFHQPQMHYLNYFIIEPARYPGSAGQFGSQQSDAIVPEGIRVRNRKAVNKRLTKPKPGLKRRNLLAKRYQIWKGKKPIFIS